MLVKESTVWNRCYLQGTVRTSGENGIALEFPTLADSCCNIFTLLTWASCLLNPLYPPALHPGVQEQTRRGDETLCREGRELNATACVCVCKAHCAALVFVVVCSVAVARCGDYIVYTSQLLRHRLFYLPLLFVCLSFVPALWGECCLLYLQSGCTGFSVTFGRSLFLWQVEIFNTRGLYLLHIYLRFIVRPECLPFQPTFCFCFFDSACSSAALYVLCLCVSAWGEGRPFICDCLCLRLYITPLLPVCRPSSKFLISLSLLPFLSTCACVCLRVCQCVREEGDRDGGRTGCVKSAGERTVYHVCVWTADMPCQATDVSIDEQ